MLLEALRDKWWNGVLGKKLEHEKIYVRRIKPREALGSPHQKDFPLLKGHEVIVEAEFKGAFGQAFTDEPLNYEGSLESVYSIPLINNANRALLVATINATYKYLKLVDGTVHCRDEKPELCGAKIVEYLKARFPPETKILMIGFQPAIAYNILKTFESFRVTDMDPLNIGQFKRGVFIESYKENKSAIAWCDVVLATGSTIVNGSVDEILALSKGKKLIFYGVTIASAAYEFNLERLCLASF